MELKAAYLSALIVMAASAGAAAGPVAEAGQRAEAFAAEGKTLEALQALDEAVDEIWTASPLLFRDVTLVGSDEENGSEARADRVFQPDEQLRVRVEPVGYGYKTSGERAQIGFSGDLAVENATGQVLAEAKDLFSVSVDSAPDDRHFDMTISFIVPYVRPGDYFAKFTVRDQNSTKSGSFDVPFSVSAPMAGANAADAAAPQPGSGGAPAADGSPALPGATTGTTQPAQ